eukprot:TRINITY_DN1780_c0_g1_i12.p2 TRINITY_DN1780_c0_g1~~TRINITY_DN1780_c0_g1_i12.p2  ORF type:complete len:255 (+),score=26.94 TRINITY_DN1780_c0_g1_i12:58-822(+)
MAGHHHNPNAATQNCGNSLGARPSVRISELYLRDNSGDALRAIIEADHPPPSTRARSHSSSYATPTPVPSRTAEPSLRSPELARSAPDKLWASVPTSSSAMPLPSQWIPAVQPQEGHGVRTPVVSSVRWQVGPGSAQSPWSTGDGGYQRTRAEIHRERKTEWYRGSEAAGALYGEEGEHERMRFDEYGPAGCGGTVLAKLDSNLLAGKWEEATKHQPSLRHKHRDLHGHPNPNRHPHPTLTPGNGDIICWTNVG